MRYNFRMSSFSGTNLPSLLLAAAAVFLFSAGVRAIAMGSRTIYFRHRRQRVLAGWWMTGAGLALGLVAFLVFRPGGSFLPASPTPAAPAQTVSPTAPPTRTAPPAPTLPTKPAFTSAASPTPHLPLSLEIMVISTVTPQPSATIGDIRFAEALQGNYPIGNRVEWRNPLKRMYASFAYTHMTYGVQFTALWFRNGELVAFESGPWKTGGHGRVAVKWEPAPQEWHPGEYEVQFFVGTEWKATGRFSLKGNPPTSTFTPTLTPTDTPRPTSTSTFTPTLAPSPTPTATVTPAK